MTVVKSLLSPLHGEKVSSLQENVIKLTNHFTWKCNSI